MRWYVKHSTLRRPHHLPGGGGQAAPGGGTQSRKQSGPAPPLPPTSRPSPEPQGPPHGSLCLSMHTEAGALSRSHSKAGAETWDDQGRLDIKPEVLRLSPHAHRNLLSLPPLDPASAWRAAARSSLFIKPGGREGNVFFSYPPTCDPGPARYLSTHQG